MITAKVLGYIEESFYQQFVTLMREAEKTLNGLMRYVREQRRGGDLYKNSVIREEAGTYEAEFSDYLDELRPHE